MQTGTTTKIGMWGGSTLSNRKQQRSLQYSTKQKHSKHSNGNNQAVQWSGTCSDPCVPYFPYCGSVHGYGDVFFRLFKHLCKDICLILMHYETEAISCCNIYCCPSPVQNYPAAAHRPNKLGICCAYETVCQFSKVRIRC
jgi:hypothetical protein